MVESPLLLPVGYAIAAAGAGFTDNYTPFAGVAGILATVSKKMDRFSGQRSEASWNASVQLFSY